MSSRKTLTAKELRQSVRHARKAIAEFTAKGWTTPELAKVLVDLDAVELGLNAGNLDQADNRMNAALAYLEQVNEASTKEE